MPIAKIQTPDGKVISLEVPEGATEAQIMQFISTQDLSQFEQQPTAQSEQVQSTGVDSDIPTDENLAKQYQTPESDSSFLDEVRGVSDAILTTITAVPAGIAGGLTGFAQGVGEQVFGDGTQEDTFNLMNEYTSALTREPTTKEGRELVQKIAELSGKLPAFVGTAPLTTTSKTLSSVKSTPIKNTTKLLKDTGSAAKTKVRDVSDVLSTLDPTSDIKVQDVLPSSINQSPRIKRAIIAEQLRSGSPTTDMVTKSLNADGNLVTNKTSKRALGVLNKAIGDTDAAKTVSAIENMTPANKIEVSKMLKIVDRGQKEGVFGDINRPSDILGDAIGTRAQDIFKLNKKAGIDIGNTAKSIKENVDISAPANKFIGSLQDMGVTFSRGEDGWVTPDFSRSKFKGGDKQGITVLINELKNGNKPFESAHKLKQEIRDNVSYDVGGAGQLKGQSENLFKDLSREINDVLVSKSDKYSKANARFAETIKLKEDFAKMAGKDIDIFSDISPKALGTKARQMTSNAQGRAPMIQLMTEADRVLEKNGVRLKTDIATLAHITNQIEKAFKIAPQNSLKGNLVTAGADVVDAAASPVATARGFGNYLKEMTKPDYNKTMRAFRSLTEQGKK